MRQIKVIVEKHPEGNNALFPETMIEPCALRQVCEEHVEKKALKDVPIRPGPTTTKASASHGWKTVERRTTQDTERMGTHVEH